MLGAGGLVAEELPEFFRGATVLQLLGNLTFSDYVSKIFSSKTLDIFALLQIYPWVKRIYLISFYEIKFSTR